MSSGSRLRVALLQGNETVARLMGEFLEEQTFEVELLEGPPPGAPRAHLVIIDVDSGVESAQRWLRHCEGRQLPVLLCGVPRSRPDGAQTPWLSRPFSAEQLLRRCQEVLGQTLEMELDEQQEEAPPPIQVRLDSRESPTLEMPSANALEVLREEQWQDPEQGAEEWLDILPVDGSSSMILEIEDLSELMGLGGVLVGKKSRRTLEADELAAAQTTLSSSSWERVEQPPPGPDDGAGHGPSEVVFGAPGATDRGEATVVSTWEDVVAGDYSSVHRIATLLAEHWDRLGLTARPADRADRLQRVLTAMWRGGLESLVDELKRIPAVHGFSGRLETLPLEALLKTIREGGLRGRLEIGMGGDSFVLYLDREILEDVDSLGENTDGILLRSLRTLGAIDEESYRYYRRRQRERSGEPVEMALRAEAAVAERELFEAKQDRARQLVERMRQGSAGTFAFIEVPRDSGQAWPTQSLGIVVEELMGSPRGSSPRRSRSVPGDDAGPLSMEGPAWVSEQDVATEPEQPILRTQPSGRLDALERPFDGEEEEEPIEEVLARVKRLELLRRLGHGEDEGPAGDGYGEQSRLFSDRLQRPTRVRSGWELALAEGSEASTKEGEAGPEEETQQEAGYALGVPPQFQRWEEEREVPFFDGEPPADQGRGEE